MGSQRFSECLRQWDDARPSSLRHPFHASRDGPFDVEEPSLEIDVALPKRHDLASSETSISAEQNHDRRLGRHRSGALDQSLVLLDFVERHLRRYRAEQLDGAGNAIDHAPLLRDRESPTEHVQDVVHGLGGQMAALCLQVAERIKDDAALLRFLEAFTGRMRRAPLFGGGGTTTVTLDPERLKDWVDDVDAIEARLKRLERSKLTDEERKTVDAFLAGRSARRRGRDLQWEAGRAPEDEDGAGADGDAAPG